MASPLGNSTQQKAGTKREPDTDGSDIEDSGAGQTLVQILTRFVISILLGIVTVAGIMSWIVTKPNKTSKSDRETTRPTYLLTMLQ